MSHESCALKFLISSFKTENVTFKSSNNPLAILNAESIKLYLKFGINLLVTEQTKTRSYLVSVVLKFCKIE